MCVCARARVCVTSGSQSCTRVLRCQSSHMHTPNLTRWDTESETHDMCPLLIVRLYLPVQGNFEVTVNGDLVWSKRTIEHHGFPFTDAQVRARAPPLIKHTNTHTHTHTQAYTKHAHTRTHARTSPVTGWDDLRCSSSQAKSSSSFTDDDCHSDDCCGTT